jgi:hypothetical protein
MITSKELREYSKTSNLDKLTIEVLEAAANTIDFYITSNERLERQNSALFMDIAFLEHTNLKEK